MASGAPTHPDLRIEQTCINLKQWMREVDGSKLVSELTIPGSHDSATGESTVINTTHLLKTQSLTISEQLEQGVRFLDIRAKLFCNDYILVHGKLLLELIFTTYNYTSNRAIFRTLSQLLTPDHRVDIFRVTSGELFTNPETSTLCELMISSF